MLSQNQSSEKEIQYFLKIILVTHHYITDLFELTVSNFMGNSIGSKRVNMSNIVGKALLIIGFLIGRALLCCRHIFSIPRLNYTQVSPYIFLLLIKLCPYVQSNKVLIFILQFGVYSSHLSN